VQILARGVEEEPRTANKQSAHTHTENEASSDSDTDSKLVSVFCQVLVDLFGISFRFISVHTMAADAPSSNAPNTVGSFLKYHFGTDLLLSSWLFLLSSILFVIFAILEMVYASDYAYLVLFAVVLVVTLVFTVGSYIFLLLSYPDAVDEMMGALILLDMDKLTFTERYFTGNYFLIMAWIFLLAYCIMFAYPIWAMIDGALTIEYGIIFIVLLLACMPVLIIFVVACFPHNLIHNNGAGSSHVYDFLFHCCFECDTIQYHFGTDMLMAVWGFWIFAMISVIVSIAFVAFDPTGINIFQLVACVIFFVGVDLMLIAVHPGKLKSDVSWRVLTCRCFEKPTGYTGYGDSNGTTTIVLTDRQDVEEGEESFGGDSVPASETTSLLKKKYRN
jgi:hypothetical protein